MIWSSCHTCNWNLRTWKIWSNWCCFFNTLGFLICWYLKCWDDNIFDKWQIILEQTFPRLKPIIPSCLVTWFFRGQNCLKSSHDSFTWPSLSPNRKTSVCTWSKYHGPARSIANNCIPNHWDPNWIIQYSDALTIHWQWSPVNRVHWTLSGPLWLN